MLRVKVCGITRPEDARAAVAYGADALGFIFYPSSPRYISPEIAAAIAADLPAGVARVGVFVNPDARALQEHLERIKLDVLQIHGVQLAFKAADFPALHLIRAFQVGPGFKPQRLAAESGWTAFLLDAYRQGEYGGTGKTFDWSVAVEARRYGRLILAGGLSPDNIQAAVEAVGPYAVDVNSAVEVRPGIKDHQKLKQLFENVKEYRYERKNDSGKLFPMA